MNTFRNIPLNAKHPDDIVPTYMGDSVGHWERDTLVVDIIGFNDRTWLQGTGTFHTESLHVTERFTRIDKDQINYEATMEDPNVFTKPWTIRSTIMVTALLSLVYLLRVSVTMTGTALLALVLYSFVSKQGFKRIRTVFREAAMAQSEVSGRLIESLSGIRVVKGYHAEAREDQVFSKGVEKMLGISLRTMSKNSSRSGASP